MRRTNVTLGWALSSETGWGLLGKYTALNLLEQYAAVPRIASLRNQLDLDPIEQAFFALIEERSARLRAELPPPPATRIDLPGVAIAALSNNLKPQFNDTGLSIRGERNLALTFAETSMPDPVDVARLAADYDAVIAGSNWGADVLRRAGLERPRVAVQGVDRRLFHPGPARDRLRDRFIIFSGGKFEYRKGQDVVLAAFRRFQRRHPEALLCAMWHNRWLRGRGLRLFELSPHYPWIPRLPPKDGNFDWTAFMSRLDIAEGRISILVPQPHRVVAEVMRYADVAVFPNRAEAGTNLVAMQTMACGIPTVLSANTGHLDIIEDGACLPLLDQTPLGERVLEGEGPDPTIAAWCESSVDELDDALERVYRDRAAARRIGEAGARWMARFGWAEHTRIIAEAAGVEPLAGRRLTASATSSA